MISIVVGFIFGFAFIIQTTFLKMLGGIVPDTILLTAIYCGLKYMKIRGYQIGVVAGLIQDIFSIGLLGINMLAKGLIGFACGWLREIHIVDPSSPLTWTIIIFLGTAVNEIVMRLYLTGFFGAPFPLMDAFFSLIFQAFLNILLGIPLFFFLDWLEVWLKQALGYRKF